MIEFTHEEIEEFTEKQKSRCWDVFEKMVIEFPKSENHIVIGYRTALKAIVMEVRAQVYLEENK